MDGWMDKADSHFPINVSQLREQVQNGLRPDQRASFPGVGGAKLHHRYCSEGEGSSNVHPLTSSLSDFVPL